MATDLRQGQIADELGLAQPVVSQQLKFDSELDEIHPEFL